MTYRGADGDEINIGVISRPPGTFASEVEAVRAAPTADTFLRTVRGHDAIVRTTGRPGTTSVTWMEPSGNLVAALISTVSSGALEPDLTLLDHLVELDEATFQAMVTERSPG